MFTRFWDFIKSNRDFIYILIILVGVVLFMGQCNRTSNLDREVHRLENNIYAITDELNQYKDENGRIIAEKHAYQLTEQELRDSVNLLKIKNREYLAYINSQIGIRDTVFIPTFIERPDSTVYADEGSIKFNRFDTFGKSIRNISVSIPYTYNDKLYTGHADIDIYHNIFVESMIERDTKTGETYVRLISDYPDLTFNSGMGVIVTNSKSYEKSMRKTKGIGLAVGPSVMVGYDMVNKNPTIAAGVSLTLGFTYTPRWTQW